jgi:hypothetical protein
MVSVKLPGPVILFAGICLLAACHANPKKAAPDNKAVWQKLGPGGGGSTFIPVFSWHNPEKFIVRCDMTGSYLTNDGGISYRQVNLDNGAAAYAYDPLDSNTIYIGGTGLQQSTDAGFCWRRILPAPQEIKDTAYFDDHASFGIQTTDNAVYHGGSGVISHIIADPIRRGVVYCSMDDHFLYTTNAGLHWKSIATGKKIIRLYTNTGLLANQVYIFSASTIFVFNKTTGTVTARDLPASLSPVFSLAAGESKQSGDIVFYALHEAADRANTTVETELWISKDAGLHWVQSGDTLITKAVNKNHAVFNMIACAAHDADHAYIVANDYTDKGANGHTKYWYGVLKTASTGLSWNWVWKGGGGAAQQGLKDGQRPANLTDAWADKAFGGELIMLFDAGVAPNDGNTAVITDWYRTMKTRDGGKTWMEVYSKTLPDSSYTSRGMDITTSYGVHFDPFDSIHIAISYTDIGFHHSYNRGESWTRSVTGVPSNWVNTCYWVAFDPSVKNKLWSAWSGMHDIPRGKMIRNPGWKNGPVANGGICLSEDGGNTWRPCVNGMGTRSPATSIIIDTASPVGKRVLYATVYNKGVFKSVDDGRTWVLKNKGLDSNTCTFSITVTANGNLFLVLSPGPQHREGRKGAEIYNGAVYRSVDKADSWQRLNVSDGWLFPNNITCDPKNPNRLYLACWSAISLADMVGRDVAAPAGNPRINMPGGIFMSEDGGNTWKSIFDQKQYVYAVTADPYHAGRLYCNTFNRAAWRSNDYGAHWSKIKGYDFQWGHRVIADQNDHEKVFLTTYGSSVWHGVPAVE